VKAAVSGASGHVGANLCRALLERGFAVRGLYREHAIPAGLGDVRRIHGDVRDADVCRRLSEGVDVVFHLAGRISIEGDPDGSVWSTNVSGTQTLLQVCLDQDVGRVIHFSSIHALDQAPQGEDLRENRPLAGAGALSYDRSKAASEAAVQEYVNRGLDVVTLNPTAIIGPADHRPSRTGQLFLALQGRRLPSLVSGGFDWVDVRDVVEAAIAAVDRGRTGERYLLSGHWRSMAELAALAESVTGVPAPRLRTPLWLAEAALPVIRLISRLAGTPPLYTSESLKIIRESNRHVRSDKAAKELGFRARPIEDSVRDLYDWFARQGMLSESTHA
jgi:dihydroflavonol-4-reductase